MRGFTSAYKVDRLVYFEVHGDVMQAIRREKNIKGWQRRWKIELIEKENPNWDSLYESIT